MGPLRKSNGVGLRQPMPDESEVERRFNLVLQQMDLPPERAKILRGYEMSKKWEMISDHVSISDLIFTIKLGDCKMCFISKLF